MAAAGSGAVFFLGTRAHYQVLQQPETQFDLENGNTSETVYQNPNAQLWPKLDNVRMDQSYVNGTGNYYCDLNDANVVDDKDGIKRRSKRRTSETTLCERDDMKPADLNDVTDNDTPKQKRRSILAFLTSLSRRKKRLDVSQLQYLDAALNGCTYKESCRCFECQSRYFECDDDEEDNFSECSSDESEYSVCARAAPASPEEPEEDDEVFVEPATGDGDDTSTSLLLEPAPGAPEPAPAPLHIEVAAGTPVLLDYLLTHPVTCVLQ